MANDESLKRYAEITVEDGVIKVILNDTDALRRVRVTLPPVDAYKLGEALCLNAIGLLRGDIDKDLGDILDGK